MILTCLRCGGQKGEIRKGPGDQNMFHPDLMECIKHYRNELEHAKDMTDEPTLLKLWEIVAEWQGDEGVDKSKPLDQAIQEVIEDRHREACREGRLRQRALDKLTEYMGSWQASYGYVYASVGENKEEAK